MKYAIKILNIVVGVSQRHLRMYPTVFRNVQMILSYLDYLHNVKYNGSCLFPALELEDAVIPAVL